MSDDMRVRAARLAVRLRTWGHRHEASLVEDLAEEVAEEVGALRATIEDRDDALLRAGRDNLRLHSIVEQVREAMESDPHMLLGDLPALVNFGAPDPRRIDSAEELDALPFTAVIRETLPLRATGNDLSRVWEKWRDGWMCIGGKANNMDTPELPVVVLWLPEVSS